METLPVYLNVLFIGTTLLTVWLLYKATNNSGLTLILLLTWLALQALIASTGFYTISNTLPPRFVLMVLPPLLLIIFLFSTKKGRTYIDGLDPAILTFLHVVRVPVELCLLLLFMFGAVPQLMTFEGRNFDIISGVTAPIIFYLGYRKQKLSKGILLIWNFACLALLFNIVIHAVLSAPFAFQQLAFDQPNVAVLYFPFNWLPSCIVPVVLFSHLVCIRRLLKTS